MKRVRSAVPAGGRFVLREESLSSVLAFLVCLPAAVAFLLAAPVGVLAQASAAGPQAATLAGVEAALDSGRVEAARSRLRAWRDGPGRRAGRSARTRATFLRARLTADPDSAEALYLDVALSGDPRYGDDSWLRLAQLHLARGEPARAAEELERLRTDYPDSELVEESRRWSAMADTASAGGPAVAANPSGAAGGAGERGSGGGSGTRSGSRDRPGAGPGAGFTVQMGAFREREGARELARRARQAGFEVHVTPRSSEDGLYRVRSRGLATRREAAELARRIRDRQLPAMVVETSDGGRS